MGDKPDQNQSNQNQPNQSQSNTSDWPKVDTTQIAQKDSVHVNTKVINQDKFTGNANKTEKE